MGSALNVEWKHDESFRGKLPWKSWSSVCRSDSERKRWMHGHSFLCASAFQVWYIISIESFTDFVPVQLLFLQWKFCLCCCLTFPSISPVIQADTSSWTAEVPSSVKGLLGSCAFIPCSYNYPDPGRTLTGFTGIWTDVTNHIVYHPVESKVMAQFRSRTKLLGDLRHKNCSLSIDPLLVSDTGPFHFRIEIADYDGFSYKAKEVSITVLSK